MLWMLMDIIFLDLDKIPVRAKINTLISSDLAASELLNNFLFCFQDHFTPLRIGPPSWKTFTVILVDRPVRSTNFENKSLLHVNSCTHITPYISNIEVTNKLLDLQFCRYKWTPLQVTSAKYEVVTSNFAIFMPENVDMYQIVFMTTINTMLFLSVLQKF